MRHVEKVTGSDEDCTHSESFVAYKDLGNRLVVPDYGDVGSMNFISNTSLLRAIFYAYEWDYLQIGLLAKS